MMRTMTKPRVALAMPFHAPTLHKGAAQGFYLWPSSGDNVEVVGLSDCVSSLLCQSFNTSLAKALDARDRGEIDYFALLHSDIEPEPYWLDKLAGELARYQADVISAVIPIKEPAEDPRTSTAIGALDNPWYPARYVRRSDRDRLPETFGAADVCGPDEVLLINTGCMLIDLRDPFWDTFAFTIEDRITQVGGKRVAQVCPEDWRMSRQLHAAGLRYLATWSVKATHHGAAGWPNF